MLRLIHLMPHLSPRNVIDWLINTLPGAFAGPRMLLSSSLFRCLAAQPYVKYGERERFRKWRQRNVGVARVQAQWIFSGADSSFAEGAADDPESEPVAGFDLDVGVGRHLLAVHVSEALCAEVLDGPLARLPAEARVLAREVFGIFELGEIDVTLAADDIASAHLEDDARFGSALEDRVRIFRR